MIQPGFGGLENVSPIIPMDKNVSMSNMTPSGAGTSYTSPVPPGLLDLGRPGLEPLFRPGRLNPEVGTFIIPNVPGDVMNDPDTGNGGTTGGGPGGVGSGGTLNPFDNLAAMFAGMFGGANDVASGSPSPVAPVPAQGNGVNWALVGVALAVVTIGYMWFQHHKGSAKGKAT